MSTKFAIRPAPRKRPWICKRSPPCLIPKPVPDPLMCSFFLDTQNPAHSDGGIRGTLLLYATGPPWHWEGAWTDTGAWFNCLFNWEPGPRTAWAHSSWITTLAAGLGTWERLAATPPPNLLYHSFHVETTTEPWVGDVLITM